MDTSYTLITGAAGFIGSSLVERILHEGRNVIALDCFLPDLYPAEVKRRRWRKLSEIKSGQLIQIEFDLRFDDFSKLTEHNIVGIINQAAMPGLNRDWSRFERYYECNINALHRTLEFAKTLNLRSFIQASTSSVYGRYAVGNEEQDLSPTSPYGVSKLAAEKLLLSYLEWFGTPVQILRYFSVYGPNQRPDMAYSRIIEAVINSSEFEVFGDGEQIRSNTYIDDVVDATLSASRLDKPGSILNICGSEALTLNNAISEIETILGKKLLRKNSPIRFGDQKDTSGSSEKAKNILGWSPKIDFRTGIRKQIETRLNSGNFSY